LNVALSFKAGIVRRINVIASAMAETSTQIVADAM
jgi:hypothetical protein